MKMKITKTEKLLVAFFMICSNLSFVNAQTLKELATQKGKFIGTAVTDAFISNNKAHGDNYYRIAGEQFNAVVAENAFKMESILPSRPANPFNVQKSDLRLDLVDRFLGYGEANKMLIRGHVLIWYGQAPSWLASESKNWSSQQLNDFATSYIKAIVGYCKGRVKEWDVVNEAFTDPNPSNFRSGTWYDNVSSKQDFFDNCFRAARMADANTRLYFTDYDIEIFNADGNSKNGKIRSTVKSMKSRGVPIDGVGFQTHYTSGFDSNLAANIGKSIDNLNESNLLVSLTEMDIRICGKDQGSISSADYDAQGRNYQDIVRESFSRPSCTTIIVWGFTDALSWIPGWFVTDKCNDALIYDRNYNIKPSYTGIQNAMKNLGGGNGGGNNSNVTVRAKGVTGNETLEIKFNNTTVKTVNLTTSYADYSASGIGTVSVYFNDFVGDAQVDYINVNGKIFQSEDQVSNTSVYQNGKCGGTKSEFMHCAGTITYSGSSAKMSENKQTVENTIAITVSPIPAKDMVNISGLSAGNVDVSILSLLGSTVKKVKLVATQENLNVDVRDLQSGIYLLEINQNNTIVTEKIIVE
jgi:endo-1,4-beta-xylanase